MKKMLLFFLVLLVMAGLSAAVPATITGEDSDNIVAYIDVTNQSSHFVHVGFSSTPVTQSGATLKGISEDNISKISLTTGNSSNGKAANADNSLYVYGQIYTNLACDMKLSAKTLQGAESEGGTETADHIGFTVTGTPTVNTGGGKKTLNVEKETYDDTANEEVFIPHEGDGADAVPSLTFECYELKIETNESITSGKGNTKYYSTTITAEIFTR